MREFNNIQKINVLSAFWHYLLPPRFYIHYNCIFMYGSVISMLSKILAFSRIYCPLNPSDVDESLNALLDMYNMRTFLNLKRQDTHSDLKCKMAYILVSTFACTQDLGLMVVNTSFL